MNAGGARRRVVVAFGGNAITREHERGTWEEQSANARVAARAVLELREAGHEVLLTHGNGPQVERSRCSTCSAPTTRRRYRSTPSGR